MEIKGDEVIIIPDNAAGVNITYTIVSVGPGMRDVNNKHRKMPFVIGDDIMMNGNRIQAEFRADGLSFYILPEDAILCTVM